jgi:hypothetical protein
MTRPDEDYLVRDDDLEPETTDFEAPPEDAYEQSVPAVPGERPERPRVPFEADEADAVEQAQTVDLDDEYDR